MKFVAITFHFERLILAFIHGLLKLTYRLESVVLQHEIEALTDFGWPQYSEQEWDVFWAHILIRSSHIFDVFASCLIMNFQKFIFWSFHYGHWKDGIKERYDPGKLLIIINFINFERQTWRRCYIILSGLFKIWTFVILLVAAKVIDLLDEIFIPAPLNKIQFKPFQACICCKNTVKLSRKDSNMTFIWLFIHFGENIIEFKHRPVVLQFVDAQVFIKSAGWCAYTWKEERGWHEDKLIKFHWEFFNC